MNVNQSFFRRAGGRSLRALAVGAAALVLSACSFLPKAAPDPTRFYVLGGAEAEPAVAPVRDGLTVGLRAVRVAPYLDGKSMVVRSGENEIAYRDYARWAEPLAAGVGRKLALGLLEAERVGRVFAHPFPLDVVRDVDVVVAVSRAEGRVAADGRATVSFVARFEIVGAPESERAGEVLWRETFVAPETAWKDGDHAALARGLGEAAAALVARVAEVLPTE